MMPKYTEIEIDDPKGVISTEQMEILTDGLKQAIKAAAERPPTTIKELRERGLPHEVKVFVRDHRAKPTESKNIIYFFFGLHIILVGLIWAIVFFRTM